MSSATDFRVTSQAMAEDNDEQASKQVDMSSGNVHESEKQVFASQDGSLSAWQFVCLSIRYAASVHWASKYASSHAVSLSLGLFLSFMDGSITSTAIYSIGRDFDDISDINWIAVAYFLSDVGLAVPITALSDVIGRFNAWLLAEAIFTAFSLACGFAQSLSQLIAFRCLQGVGGSGLYALGIVIWQEASTPDQRIWMGACIGFVVALAGVMGPILGGIIADKTTWRW